MQIVLHRVNTAHALESVPNYYGVEMDVHAYGSKLTVHHDAFVEGESLDSWLDVYRHQTLILNIKEEGVEKSVIAAVEKRGISNFFLLDVSAPMLYRLAQDGEKRMAVRVSAFESVETVLRLAGKVLWVFIDVMDEENIFPITKADYTALRHAGFKLCMVSHDVWGRPAEKTLALKHYLIENGYKMDAVLTKHPEWWEVKAKHINETNHD